MHNELVQAHLGAASELIQAAIAEARLVDAAGVEGLAAAMRAGAMLTLATTVTATGLASIALEVVTLAGDRHQLMALELQYSKRQVQ